MTSASILVVVFTAAVVGALIGLSLGGFISNAVVLALVAGFVGTLAASGGNATLTPNGRQVLELLAPVLRGLPGRSFQVTGHTDAQGSRPQNIALSAARADAVKAYLAGKGIAADSISTAGAGPDRPVAGNETPEGRARNRRIELRVLVG